VQLNRVADHFIFTVESSGCIAPEVIVREVSTLRTSSLLIISFGSTYVFSTYRCYNAGIGRFEGESCYISRLGGRLAARRRGTVAA
jgi:RNA polymerase Rpb3/Rpb11 dimerisation domain